MTRNNDVPAERVTFAELEYAENAPDVLKHNKAVLEEHRDGIQRVWNYVCGLSARQKRWGTRMARKTLEEKLSKLHAAKENFGAKFSDLVEALGFALSYGESKVSMYDKNAPKKERNKDCFVAYICEVSGGPKLHPAVLEHLAKYVLKDEFEGFKLYVVGSGPIVAYSAQIKEPEPVPMYGHSIHQEPVPAYGVPLPPKDKKKDLKK